MRQKPKKKNEFSDDITKSSNVCKYILEIYSCKVPLNKYMGVYMYCFIDRYSFTPHSSLSFWITGTVTPRMFLLLLFRSLCETKNTNILNYDSHVKQITLSSLLPQKTP